MENPNNSKTSNNQGDGETGSPSHYGEFYWDTHGVDSFDADSLLFDNTIMNENGRARLSRTQEDLCKYKQRIDSTVEQQKEYSEIISSMQNKLQVYRKHILDLERQIGKERSSASAETSLLPFQDSGFVGDIGDLWNASRGRSTLINNDANYDMALRLDDERQRNEEMRHMIESEHLRREQLQHELEHVRREYERDLHEKERHYQNRERNLSQYLSEEQKKILDLWAELQRVRQQFSEFKSKTEIDLNNQRNDFTRIIRSVQGVTRHMLPKEAFPDLSNNTSGFENTVFEIIRRISERGDGTSTLQPDYDLISQIKANTKEENNKNQLYQELINKYEKTIERNIELESKGDENERKVVDLETELRRMKERLSDYQNDLRKIYDLTNEKTVTDDRGNKRPRSLSPSKSTVQPAEVMRNLRNMLRLKNNEIEQLERKVRSANKQIAELVTRSESMENARQQLEKHLIDSKREISEHKKLTANFEHQIRRLEDRLNVTEYEKKTAEGAQKKLEMELQRLREQYEKTSTDDSRRTKEEADEFTANMENDYKNRIDELNRRIAITQEEKQTLKNELVPIKTKYRKLEAQYAAMQRSLEEKDSLLQIADEEKQRCLAECQRQKEQLEMITANARQLTEEKEASSLANQATEQRLRDIVQQRDELVKQRDEISRQLLKTKNIFDNEKSECEKLQKAYDVLTEASEKLKTQLADYERQIIIIRRHNDELDSQLRTGQTKINSLESELELKKKEIDNLTEFNQRLQREKQELMKSKNDTETNMENLKERTRKFEQEVEKWKIENSKLVNAEEKAKDGLTQQMKRCHFLEKELADAQEALKVLQDKFDIQEEEYKNRLKNMLKRSKIHSKTGSKDSLKDENESDEEDKNDKDIGTKDSYSHIDHVYDSEMLTIKIKEINDKWKLDMDKLENEKNQLENRVRELEDQLLQAERINERHQNDIEDAKQKLQAEIARLKNDLEKISVKHQSELEEERETHKKDTDAFRFAEEEIVGKLRATEKRLADALNLQNEFERSRRDFEERIILLTDQNQKLKDDLDNLRADSEKEVQRLKSEVYATHSTVKSLETNITGLKTQLTTSNERNTSLNKIVNDYVSKIRDLNNQLHKLEDELNETRANSSTRDIEAESLGAQLSQIEDSHLQLQIEHKKLQSDWEALNREVEKLKAKNVVLENENDKMTQRAHSMDISFKELRNSINHFKTDKERLQNAYREKVKQAEQLQKITSKLEEKLLETKKELQNISEKLIAAENDRTSLKADADRMQQELEFGKEQLIRKNEEYQNTVEDLSNAHRVAENGRLNALQELEAKKYELSDVESRMDKHEQRLAALQQDYIRADGEREMLNDILRRFQNTIKRIIVVNRFRPNTQNNEGENDEAPLDSKPFPIPEDYGVENGLDPKSLDHTLQTLTARIEQLQQDKEKYRDELQRLKNKTTATNTTINKRETHYKSIEENLIDVEDKKRSLEARLATAKHLLRSQEETMKSREEEHQKMKSKIITFELETRGKEAQIRHLNEQMKNLRSDFNNAQEELRIIRDRSDSLETMRYQLEEHIRDKDNEIQRLQIQIANTENIKEKLNEKLKELTRDLQLSENKYSNLTDDIACLRRELQKAENTESDMRRSLEQQARENAEMRMAKEQLGYAQSELTTINVRKIETETALATARTEIREQKQRADVLVTQTQELQRQLQDAQNARLRAENKQHELDKALASERTAEALLRQQNDVLKNEKRTLKKDLDELKNQLRQFEEEKSNMTRTHEQLKKEKQVLLKKLELLEQEKRKTDDAIRETALQREAIEKSLNAMERENRELYRNCAQLQNQIAQLEMENGNRIIDITKRQREEQEKQAQRIRAEKLQIEKIIENRERTFKQKIKQLELQIQTLREQLDTERKRLRDMRDRQLAGDVVRDSFGYNGRSGHGTAYIPGDSIDSSVLRFRSTFVSNPLTPPRDTSTPTTLIQGSPEQQKADVTLLPLNYDLSDEKNKGFIDTDTTSTQLRQYHGL